MRNYRRFTYSDRLQIEALLKAKVSVKEISLQFNVSRQAVYYELKKGEYERLLTDYRTVKAYSADIAQRRSDFRRTSQRPDLKIGKDHELIKNIEHLIIKKHYSPAAALSELRRSGKLTTSICVKTLYNYIDTGLFLHLKKSQLPYKPRKKKPQDAHRARDPRYGTSISERSDLVNSRSDFGHWEIDSVIGKRESGESLLVFTERKTRYQLIYRSLKTALSTNERICRIILELKRRYKELFKTITCDNGSEFASIHHIESISGTKVYYCHPYSSWERGSNEKQNQMIRRWIKKGTRIENYTDKEISDVCYWLNNYPRALFGWRTSAEMFSEECSKLGFKSPF